MDGNAPHLGRIDRSTKTSGKPAANYARFLQMSIFINLGDRDFLYDYVFRKGAYSDILMHYLPSAGDSAAAFRRQMCP